MTTTDKDAVKYFGDLLQSQKDDTGQETDADELRRSIDSAIKELNQTKTKTTKTKVVKFAGERIE